VFSAGTYQPHFFRVIPARVRPNILAAAYLKMEQSMKASCDHAEKFWCWALQIDPVKLAQLDEDCLFVMAKALRTLRRQQIADLPDHVARNS
jgi:hypothetical protein